MPHTAGRQHLVNGLGLVPLFLGLAAFWIFSDYSESLARVSDARETLTQIQTLLGAAITAETTQRGYLLTNKPAYLEPFSGSIRTVEENLHKLRPRLERDGNDPLVITQFESAVENKLDELRETVSIAQRRGPQAALEIVGSDRGQRAMTTIRDIVTLLEHHESALLAERREDLRKLRLWVASLFGFGVAVSAVLVSCASGKREVCSGTGSKRIEARSLENRTRTSRPPQDS